MRRIFLLVLLFVLAIGCVSPEIKKGSPQDYELPGIQNTTIYYLKQSSIQVVEHVMNKTTTALLLEEKSNIGDAVAVDYSGKNVSFNVSKQVIFGKSFIRFDFDSNFSGFVAFTYSDGQDFSISLMNNKSVRVVLPQNFTTGSKFLGIAKPKPDKIIIDSAGREVLIWEKPYPEHRLISVKYYSKNAPRMMSYLAVLFFISALLILGYYYLSIRALKKKRIHMEK